MYILKYTKNTSQYLDVKKESHILASSLLAKKIEIFKLLMLLLKVRDLLLVMMKLEVVLIMFQIVVLIILLELAVAFLLIIT